MRLLSIHIQDFFGFRDFTVHFGDLTVLTGPNNGGKTTILRAIQFAFDAISIEPTKQRLRNRQDERAKGRTRTTVEIHTSEVMKRQGLANRLWVFHASRTESSPRLSLVLEHEGKRIDYDCNHALGDILTIDVRLDGTSVMDSEEEFRAVSLLAECCEDIVRPLSEVLPGEPTLSWPQYLGALNEGKPESVWRNRLHWLSDGRKLADFERVASKVGEYVPQIVLNPPGRTREGNPQVVVSYKESGVDLDIALSGSGLRTITNVSSALELSKKAIILIDEPESHLHPGIQRPLAEYIADCACQDRQVVVATHSPDMIETFPLECLRWIDRSQTEAQSCQDIGKALVDLGAVSRSRAVAMKKDRLIFTESKFDYAILRRIATACGHGDIFDTCQCVPLKGRGDAEYVVGVQRVLAKLHGKGPNSVVVTDCDYDDPKPAGDVIETEGVLLVRLPCKELENLLLMNPQAIVLAAERGAEMRLKATGKRVNLPSKDQVAAKIDEITESEATKETVQCQWIALRCKATKGPVDGGVIAEAQKSFKDFWSNPENRRRCCPGKDTLATVRRWFQEDFGLSPGSTEAMFTHYQPSPEIIALLKAISDHLQRPT